MESVDGIGIGHGIGGRTVDGEEIIPGYGFFRVLYSLFCFLSYYLHLSRLFDFAELLLD